jgi:hypothetical protein
MQYKYITGNKLIYIYANLIIVLLSIQKRLKGLKIE